MLRPLLISESCFGLLPHYNMAATKKKKSASSCFQHLSAKFALFWFWSHPITKLETDIQKWLWPELSPAVEQVQNATVMDGTDLTKECNVTTGTPPLSVFWENAKSGQIIDGKLLIITKFLENDVHWCAV